MKASELRIGNYVSGLYDLEQVKAIDYSELYPEMSEIRTVDSGLLINENGEIKKTGSLTATIRSLKPIPLTEEWLLKFGFQEAYQTDGQTYFYFGGWEIEVTDGGFIFNELSFVVNIKYVHQLQNLYFALTGTELTAK